MLRDRAQNAAFCGVSAADTHPRGRKANYLGGIRESASYLTCINEGRQCTLYSPVLLSRLTAHQGAATMTDISPMSKGDRDALIRFARAQARQAEREVDSRMAVCHAEVVDQMTATFAADDALWKEAVLLANEQMEKANALIRNQVAALGIPPTEAPQISAHWYSRGSSYSNRNRRAELYKLADAKLAAMAKTAKCSTAAPCWRSRSS